MNKKKTNKKQSVKKEATKIKEESKVKEKKKLVIVESPTKAETISKYLGKKEYQVISSKGHVIDLPKSRLAVNIEKDFEPEYIFVKGQSVVIKEIKKAASAAEMVFLAADNDREGEAIAWGVKQVIDKLNLNIPIRRIVFNEITPDAIKNSIQYSRDLNPHKLDAQKARRILDRLVGYNLSPLLWKKVKSGLSAGRVQSAALKIISDRQKEIDHFKPVEYWEIDASFLNQEYNIQLLTFLFKYKSKKVEIPNKKIAEEIKEEFIKQKEYIIEQIQRKKLKKSPYPPFITSKLQQEASSKLGFSVEKTMMIAQSLYEGIKMGNDRIGFITYVRTDSLRISNESLNEVRDYINKNFGKEMLPSKPNFYKNAKLSQDAHECIRPTSVYRHPDSVIQYLNKDQEKLYRLIWNRFVASQMEMAIYDQFSIEIVSKNLKTLGIFKANFSRIDFLGFLKVYREIDDQENAIAFENQDFKHLECLKQGDPFNLKKIDLKQLFTKQPPLYTEASLVKKLESSGIGRPSTYSPTIQTLIKRGYIQRQKKQIIPTELGLSINDMISEFFYNITDSQFTANMEIQLDEIEENKKDWVKLLHDFFSDFNIKFKKAEKEMKMIKGNFDKDSNETCEKCGSIMKIKTTYKGSFLACPKFPECKNILSIPLGNCPNATCKGYIVSKKSKFSFFYGCNLYPDCNFSSWTTPIENLYCKSCNKILFSKSSKKVKNDEGICKNSSCSLAVIEKKEPKKEKNQVEKKVSRKKKK